MTISKEAPTAAEQKLPYYLIAAAVFFAITLVVDQRIAWALWMVVLAMIIQSMRAKERFKLARRIFLGVALVVPVFVMIGSASPPPGSPERVQEACDKEFGRYSSGSQNCVLTLDMQTINDAQKEKLRQAYKDSH